jgi:hypothetical protein
MIVYEDFDYKCNQLGLYEVYKTKSKSKYEWFLRLLQSKQVPCRGYGDDWNCRFEVRFQ